LDNQQGGYIECKYNDDNKICTAAGSVLYKYADASYKIIDRDAANNAGTGVCKIDGDIIEFSFIFSGNSNYEANAIYYSKNYYHCLEKNINKI